MPNDVYGLPARDAIRTSVLSVMPLNSTVRALGARSRFWSSHGVRCCLCVGVPMLFSVDAHAQDADSLQRALTDGDAEVTLRYRFEFVDDDAFELDARASTLRSTIGYRTLPYRGISAFLQAQNVASLGEAHFNNRGAGHLANGLASRPVVADPSQTRMQQACVRWQISNTSIDVGRREIMFGNHRFVGNVGWRQNHQAFDGLSVTTRSIKHTTVSYTFADNVVRVFGDEQEMNSHFFNAVVTPHAALLLDVFGYLVDHSAPVNDALSSRTLGFTLEGSPRITEDWRMFFGVRLAHQEDYGGNPITFDASYHDLVSGIDYRERLQLRVGREQLGDGDGATAFQTPLATGHRFNGWADKLLRTPDGGLVDWYASANGRAGAVGWVAAFHDFSSDARGLSLGSEVDLQGTWSTAWGQVVGATLAVYREDGFSSSVSKVWLWTQHAF